jgi:hypothetical protein
MTKLIRQTVVLLNGKEGYILSCLVDKVNTKSSESIVNGLRHGTVKLLGTSIVVGGKLSNVVGGKLTNVIDINGKKMTSPNRATRINVIDVSVRQSLGSFFSIAPIKLQEQVTPEQKTARKFGVDWPILVKPSGRPYIKCQKPCDAACGGVVDGECLISNGVVQIFKGNTGTVKDHGKWFCGCTTKPAIPKHPVKEHDVLKPGTELIRQLIKTLQEDILKPGTTIDDILHIGMTIKYLHNK